ncbi:MAG: glycosyltransferase [Solirubrobacterales bacterium]|nr:glycosyltransferase [Solirubrobacterales bacterium]
MNALLRYRPVRQVRYLLANLPRRAVLTWRYHGPREFLARAALFPLRATPFARRLGLSARASDPSAGAARWYRREGRPVAIVIPTFGPPGLVADAVKSIRRTTRRGGVRIIVCDDASAVEHVAGLERIEGIELIRGERQAGFAANVNRGLRAVRPGEDVMLLNSDVIAHHGWLERLQYGAYREPTVGLVGPKLLYPDGTIQSAGTLRNPSAPEWFDHAHRFKAGDHPEANVPRHVLAMTGAALYVKGSALERLGLLDEAYGMGYEDVDYCLRAWEAGQGVLYYPSASLTHLESRTRGMVQGQRELASQRRFWSRWGAWLDDRPVRAPDGGLRIIYVTEDTGIGGGHRNVFQHLNSLAERGHHCELWSLGERPGWFELDVPVRSFEDYGALIGALDGEEAIKVATWWNTAAPVWRASVRRGIPVYLVSDIETSYYAEDHGVHAAVRASYQPEFRFLTISGWVAGQLRGMGIEPTIVSCGLELDRFVPLDRERHSAAILALGRSNPLKNFPLTAEAFRRLPEPRPELWLFGIEPALGEPLGAKYRVAPDDVEVNELLNTATVFVQTSRHEGFCLPILEAMATGIPVVCTDAHGNRDFCRDGENCLMPAAEPAAVSQAIERVLAEPELRARLSAAGLETAAANDWSHRVDELQRFFEGVAARKSAVTG